MSECLDVQDDSGDGHCCVQDAVVEFPVQVPAAEVVSFDDLMNSGTYTAAKEKGLVRSEGKEYIMKDGDIVLFRFNV